MASNEPSDVVKNSFLSAFLAHYGSQWEAALGELEDEHGPAYLALGISRQLTEVLTSRAVRQRTPKLIVHVLILPRADTRCFVQRSPQDSNEYVLAVHFGTFANLQALLSEPAMWTSTLSRSAMLRSIDRADFYRLAAYMTISALIYHELAHIFRGHLAYVACGSSAEEKVERRRLCEVDADKWSSFILGGDILSQARGISRALYGNELAAMDVAIDLLHVVSAGLYRCLSTYNQLTVEPQTLYPHPLLRAIRIAVGAADNLTRGPDAWADIQRRLVRVLDGLAYAEEFLSAPASGQRPWDIGHELMEFERQYTGPLQRLEVELRSHVPGQA